MKVYRVKVNNKVYEVELESVVEVSKEMKTEPQPVVKNEPTKVSAGTSIKAPMQGVILSIKVEVGQTVNKGDKVIILEAMKLENDIVTPASGVVKQILVSKGQNVDNQQPLIVLE